jgi:hypothetical protein
VKEDEDVGDVAAMAELLRIGTRVLCHSMHPMYHHQPLAPRADLGSWLGAGWVDREAGRTCDRKADRPGVGWRRLQRDAHLIWQDRSCEGERAAQPLSECASLMEELVLSVQILSCGVPVFGSRGSVKT